MPIGIGLWTRSFRPEPVESGGSTSGTAIVTASAASLSASGALTATGTAAVTAGAATCAASGTVFYYPTSSDSDLVLWLDGADASTMFTDTAGTTPTPNGGAIRRWNDKSSYGYNPTAPSAGASPTRDDSNGMNSRMCGVWDGGDQMTTPTLTAFGGSSLAECWIVVRTSTGATKVLFEIGAAVAGGLSMHLTATGTAWLFQTVGNVGTNSKTKGSPDTSGHIFRGTLDYTQTGAAETVAELDGSTSGFTNGSTSNNTGTTSASLTGTLGHRGGGLLLVGALAEIIVWRRHLTAAQAAGNLARLKNKWGIA